MYRAYKTFKPLNSQLAAAYIAEQQPPKEPEFRACFKLDFSNAIYVDNVASLGNIPSGVYVPVKLKNYLYVWRWFSLLGNGDTADTHYVLEAVGYSTDVQIDMMPNTLRGNQLVLTLWHVFSAPGGTLLNQAYTVGYSTWQPTSTTATVYPWEVEQWQWDDPALTGLFKVYKYTDWLALQEE